jgi:hypothetical protein
MSSLWTSSDNGTVLVASSPDGVNWTDGTGLVSSFVRLGAGASLAGFYNGVDTQLYCAFVAGNNSPGVDTGAVLVSKTSLGDGDLRQVAIPASEGQGEPSPHREFWTRSSDPRASAR